MALWVPTADAAAMDEVSMRGNILATNVESAGLGFTSVQTSGWTGAANNAAVARAEALKTMLGSYTERVSAGSTFLHDWSGQFADYKRQFQKLDSDHTQAEQMLVGMPATAPKSGNSSDDHSAQTKLDDQRSTAYAEVTRIENQHASLLAEFRRRRRTRPAMSPRCVTRGRPAARQRWRAGRAPRFKAHRPLPAGRPVRHWRSRSWLTSTPAISPRPTS